MRNVLVITAGRTPQIVTETLFALLQRAKPRGPFIPDEIHLVTTRGAAQEFTPLCSANGMLAALYESCGLASRFKAPNIIEVQGADGNPVEDVRSESEAIAYGNCVTRLIATIAQQPDARLHVSLAGGRKTMGWYAGAALSIFGRPSDELSHVLVEPEELEMCPDFWWPTSHDHMVTHKFLKDTKGQPQRFNAKTGRIDLALIPFVRLSPVLSAEPFQGQPDYQRVVEELDDAVRTFAPVRVRVAFESRGLWIGEQKVDLPHRSFALYALLAERRKRRIINPALNHLGDSYTGWLAWRDLAMPHSKELGRLAELLSECHKTSVASPAELLEALQKELATDPVGFLESWRVHKARISGGKKGELQKVIRNPRILQQARIEQIRLPNGERPFGLALDPRQIDFVAAP